MPDWKDTEEVAAILEAILTPSAKVQHNIHLPVLKSRSGRKRQCDVVITYGQPPRETISIVEVQDRNSKVDINTFGGWLKKKEEVGAQHLICVSRLPYPNSIIEEAADHGPGVRLMTLEELERHELPEDLQWNFNPYYVFKVEPAVTVLASYDPAIKKLPPIRQFGAKDQVFVYRGERTSAAVLWKRYEDKCYSDTLNGSILEGTHTVYAKYPDDVSLICADQTVIPINLTIKGTIHVEHHPLEISYESYMQDDKMLSWVVTFNDPVNGDAFKLPFLRAEDGRLTLGTVAVHKSMIQRSKHGFTLNFRLSDGANTTSEHAQPAAGPD